MLQLNFCTALNDPGRCCILSCNQFNFNNNLFMKRNGNVYITEIQSDGNIIEDTDSSNLEASYRETFRLASYNMCKVAAPPYLLAMAGFYRIGPGDRSRCFSCGNCVESWKVTDDVSSPSWHKPDCKHILQEDSGNIKLADPSQAGSSSGDNKTPKVHNQQNISKAATSSTYANAGYPPDAGPSAQAHFPPMPSTSRSSHPPFMLSTVHHREHQMLLESLSLHVEEDRRKSFSMNWPIHLTCLVNSLSESGFFFLGNHERTQCFSCGAVLKGWFPSDNVAAVHAERFPECRMVQHREPQNVPLPRVQGHYFDPEDVHHFDTPANLNEYPSSMYPLPRSGPAYAPFHVEQSIDENVARYPSLSFLHSNHEIAHSSGISSQNALSSYRNESVESLRSSSYPSTVLSSRLSSRIARPFQSNLPSSRYSPIAQQAPVSYRKTQIAQPYETVVMQPIQRPYDPVASYPPDQTSQQAVASTSSNVLDVLDPYAATRRLPPRLPESELDVGEYVAADVKRILQSTYPCDGPVNPSMVYFGQRLSSFRAPWPENDSQSTITEIAEAGFYYLGLLDHVCCWYCGTKAKNWAHKSIAWEVHARLFPTCQYVLRNRGPDFVEAVLSQVVEENRPANERMSLHVSGQETPTTSVVPVGGGWQVTSYPVVESGPDRLPTPPPPLSAEEEAEEKREEYRRSMTSDVVRTALELGFPRRHIRKVVKNQIEQWSCNYQTSEALIDALVDFRPDLIDLDSSDDEEEIPPPRRDNNQGISFEDLDDTTEIYQSGESSIANPTEDIENEITSNRAVETPGPSRGQPARQAPRSSRMGDLNDIRSKLVELRNEKRCKVCLDREGCMLFTPCGHICACEVCARSLRHCPICRTQIRQAIRTYTP